jgi:hypothetical protein
MLHTHLKMLTHNTIRLWLRLFCFTYRLLNIPKSDTVYITHISNNLDFKPDKNLN